MKKLSNHLYKLTKYSINIIMVLITIFLPLLISIIPFLIFLQTENSITLNGFILSIPIAIITAFFMWPGGKLFKVMDSYMEQDRILGEYLNTKWNEI